MGIGTGYGQAKTTGSVLGTDVTAHYSGIGPAFELLIGGTPGAGFVVGGGFIGQDIWDPAITIDSNDPTIPSNLNVNGALGVGAIGPFIDWFPDDTGGAHVGAMLGIGIIGLENDRSFGGSAWTGYDFWIANQWSFGVEGRAAFASGKRDIDMLLTSSGFSTVHFEDSASSFELLFTALLH
jgi:hypothetical protein